MLDNNDNQNQENTISFGESKSSEIVSEEKNNEVIEEEHVNPYMKYSPLDYYYIERYEYAISDIVNDDYFLFAKSIDELQILRNLPFAKKGHDFKNSDLAEFFSKEDWYEKVPGKSVALSELNTVEQKALSIIDAKIHNLKDIESSVPKYTYDPNKEIVYSFYKYKDDYRKFDFPYINIDAENVEKLNESIYNWAMPIILGTYFECDNAEYEYYLNNDILTVIIEEECGYGGESGYHLNIDLNTGEYISDSEFLTKNGLDIENILDLKDKLLDSKITSPHNSTGMTLRDYDSRLKLTFATDVGDYENLVNEKINNPEKWILVYLDYEQNVHVIVYLPTLAGAADAYQFVDCIVEI